MDNGKPQQQMLENSARVEVENLMKDQAPALPQSEQPVGTVKRVLHFRDRQLILWSCREYCKLEGKGDYKNQSKLTRIQKILSMDEVNEYFAMLEDDLQERRFDWQRLTNDYLFFRQYHTGVLTLEELEKRAPDVDPEKPPAKQSPRQPRLSRAEQEGKARAFYLPSKLDVWIQDVLKNSEQWPDFMNEFVTELCEKYDVKDE